MELFFEFKINKEENQQERTSPCRPFFNLLEAYSVFVLGFCTSVAGFFWIFPTNLICW